MPSMELFLRQGPAYRDAVLPPAVKARVAVEAGSSFGWREVIGDAGEAVCIDHFGASAPGGVLFENSGLLWKMSWPRLRLLWQNNAISHQIHRGRVKTRPLST